MAGSLMQPSSLQEYWYQLISGSKRDYLTTFLATGVMQICGIFSGILTARLLGPTGKGEISIVLWLPSLMTAVGIISLPQAVAFQVSRQPEQSDEIMATAFWFSLCLGIVEGLILFPFIPKILGSGGSQLVRISRIFLIYLPVSYCGLTLLGIDQGKRRFTRYNLLRLLPQVLYIASLAILTFFKNASVTNVLLVNLVAQVITSAIRIMVAGDKLTPKNVRLNAQLGKKMVKQGLIYTLPALSGIILMRVDMAMLIHAVKVEKVGFYAVAMAIAMGQTGITSSIIQVNFPRVSSTSRSEAEILLWRHFRKSIMPLLGSGIIAVIFSPLIIKHLFGEQFTPALPMTYILILAISIWGMTQVLENGLRGLGFGIPGALANCFGILTLIPSSLYLMRTFDAAGMAMSMVLSQVVVLGILFFSFRHIHSTIRSHPEKNRIAID